MRAMSATRVMVVEDHGLLAQSLRLTLTAEGMAVSVPPLDPAEILAVAERDKPEVVLLDLDLGPLGGDGAALIEPLALTGARVIVVSGETDRVRLTACIESGAHGLVSKAAPLDELLSAILRTAAGEDILPGWQRDKLLSELRLARAARRRELAPFESLTVRECTVLAAIMAGRSAAQIAAAEYLSEATVRTHIRGILNKLGVSSQLAAVAEAGRVAWRPPASRRCQDDAPAGG